MKAGGETGDRREMGRGLTSLVTRAARSRGAHPVRLRAVGRILWESEGTMAGALDGKRLFYEEDGQVLEVDVISDTSDHDWVRLQLKQVRVLDPGPYKQSPDGTEFDVSARNDFACYGGMWTLRVHPGGMVVAPYIGKA